MRVQAGGEYEIVLKEEVSQVSLAGLLKGWSQLKGRTKDLQPG